MNYLISRHQGAVQWLDEKGFDDPVLITHASPEFLASLTESDFVFGTLPIHLACEVCGKGARFFNLVMDVPAEFRGQELTAEKMDEFGARLTEYRIYECGRRTRLADMAKEFTFIATTLAKSGESLRALTAICRKAWQAVNYK